MCHRVAEEKFRTSTHRSYFTVLIWFLQAIQVTFCLHSLPTVTVIARRQNNRRTLKPHFGLDPTPHAYCGSPQCPGRGGRHGGAGLRRAGAGGRSSGTEAAAAEAAGKGGELRAAGRGGGGASPGAASEKGEPRTTPSSPRSAGAAAAGPN